MDKVEGILQTLVDFFNAIFDFIKNSMEKLQKLGEEETTA